MNFITVPGLLLYFLTFVLIFIGAVNFEHSASYSALLLMGYPALCLAAVVAPFLLYRSPWWAKSTLSLGIILSALIGFMFGLSTWADMDLSRTANGECEALFGIIVLNTQGSATNGRSSNHSSVTFNGPDVKGATRVKTYQNQ